MDVLIDYVTETTMGITIINIPRGDQDTTKTLQYTLGNIDRTVSLNFSSGSYSIPSFSGLTPGKSYTFVGLVTYTSDGKEYQEVCTYIQRTRPENFVWSNPESFYSGEDFEVKATDWNDLCETIRLMQLFCGMTNVSSFTRVSKGDTITDEIFNEVKSAISRLPLATKDRNQLPRDVQKGEECKASYFTALTKALSTITWDSFN